MASQTLTIRRPDDWHVHLRDGDMLRAVARWAGENGAEYLHGAVYAVPQTIGTAASSINCSGSAAVHERWRERLGR